MDLLLSKFVNKYLDFLNYNELILLEQLLNIDDEILYHWYFKKRNTKLVPVNKISKKLKEFKVLLHGGEGGIRTHEWVAPSLVFKTSAFNRSATSPESGYMVILILLQDFLI